MNDDPIHGPAHKTDTAIKSDDDALRVILLRAEAELENATRLYRATRQSLLTRIAGRRAVLGLPKERPATARHRRRGEDIKGVLDLHIVDYVTQHPGMCARDILGAAGRDYSTGSSMNALKRLIDKGLRCRTGKRGYGVHGGPGYRYWPSGGASEGESGRPTTTTGHSGGATTGSATPPPVKR